MLRGVEKKSVSSRRVTDLLRDLTNALRLRFEEGLRGSAVTVPQLRMLKAIDSQPAGASAASIARTCQVTPQTLHAMLNRAQREGWITRGSSERNHRFVTAALTEAGRAHLAAGSALRDKIEAEMWQNIPGQELEAARGTLERALSNLNHGTEGVESSARHPKA
jgi:MarR family transcriptional regulator, organic hydroperoxide resistance regulator